MKYFVVKLICLTRLLQYIFVAHFMKMVSKDLKDVYEDNFRILFLKQVIRKWVTLKDFGQIERWFYYIAVLLGERNNHPGTIDAYHQLLSMCNSDKNVEFDKMENLQMPLFDRNEIGARMGLFKSSPFFKHFTSILPVQFESQESTDLNQFYNPQILKLIMEKYMPFVPLWSALLIRQVYDVDQFSNAYVENHFGNLKNNI